MSDTEERLERYLAGEMSASERVAFEDAVLADPALADQLYADESVRAALDTAARARRERAVASAPRAPWWRRRRMLWLAPGLAVAAVVVFMVTQQQPSPGTAPVLRGAGGAIEVIEPTGDVEAPPTRFAWHSSATASAYRFEVFVATQSAPVYSTTVTDTVVTLDNMTSPAQGYWTVTPLNDLGVSAGNTILTHYRTIE